MDISSNVSTQSDANPGHITRIFFFLRSANYQWFHLYMALAIHPVRTVIEKSLILVY